MLNGAYLRQNVVASLVHLIVIEAAHEFDEFVELARSNCDAWVECASVKYLFVGTLGSFSIVLVRKYDLVILWVVVEHSINC